MEINQIQIKYHDPNMPKLEFIGGKSDWVDLRARYGGTFKAGDYALIDLGVSMKLPEGYEAHMAPRSSTFKNYGVLQTNSVAIIDGSYNGTNDVWRMPCYFTCDTTIQPYDRICQFRIVKNMPPVQFIEKEELENKDRGSFGTTGVK